MSPPLDPTFGKPLPKKSAPAAKLPKDADWIWTATTTDTEVAAFRHVLKLGQAPKKARLYVTADNYVKAYVNGKQVALTEPGPDDNLIWAKTQVVDVTGILTAGTNTVAVQATNAGGQAGMLLRLEIDGKPALFSDDSWKVTTPAPSDDWTAAGYNDSSWEKATAEAKVGQGVWGAQLKGWPVPLAVAANYLAHLKMPPVFLTNAGRIRRWEPTGEDMILRRPGTDAEPWTAVVDFGKELSGRVSVSSETPLSLKVGTGESDLESLQKPWTSTEMELGANTGFTPYTALRYAALTFPANVEEVRIKVSMDHLYYPVQYLGSFDCSDPVFTRIWYTGAYTAHLCMQEDIWDAPKRDRARWMGDLHVSGEVINNVFLDKFLMEQTMDRLRSDAQGGRKETELPGGHVNGIPGYSCAWVAGVADFYRHTGDAAWLQKQHQPLITMLEFLRSELGPNGVYANNHKQWCYVDWAPLFNGDSPQAYAATHLFLVKAVKEAIFIFKELGDTASAAKYQAWSDELTRVAQQNFLSDEGTFGDRRQENAMAIYSGVATPSQTANIYSKILAPTSPAWGYVASPYYNNYVLDAITSSGHMQDAMKFVRDYWGGMLSAGATTWWEGYDPSWPKDQFVDNAWPKANFHTNLQADNGTGYFVSLCHGWSAGPTNWLTERVLGVKTTGAGFKTCTINPNIGYFNWASGTVPTPHGLIKVRVDKAESKYKVTVTIPKGVEAHLGSTLLKSGTQTLQIDAPTDAN